LKTELGYSLRTIRVSRRDAKVIEALEEVEIVS
jgi:hypothetical protein